MVASCPVPFPLHTLPTWLRQMVEATAEHAQTDVTMPGAACFGILSAAVARKARVQVRDRRFPLHLWVLISAESGSGKTTVFNALRAPIEEAIHADPTSPRPRVRVREPRTRFEHMLEDDDLEEPEPPRVTSADVARTIAAAQTARGLPVGGSMVAEDTTPTALLSLMAEWATGVALISDEAGFEGWLTGGGPVAGQNAATLSRVWSGENVQVRRQGRVVQVDDAALTMLVGVQPTIVAPLMRHNTLRARGFTLRMLYCEPELRHRHFPSPAIRPRVETAYARNIHALMALPGWGSTDRSVLRASAVAARLNDAFGNAVEGRRAPTGELRAVRDYAGRFTSNLPRLAGLLHLARHAGSSWEFILTTPISEETMQHAVDVAEFFLEQGAAMFGSPIVRSGPPVRPPTQQPQDLIEAVRTLVAVSSPWQGSGTRLLEALHRIVEEPRRVGWPRGANSLTRYLRAQQAQLEARGVVLSDGRTGRRRTLVLTLVPPPSSSPPSPSR